MSHPNPSSPQWICLTGFMGSGKSTVGAALAQTLGWGFIDLDQRIVDGAGRSIAQIFSEDGEPAFRRLESDVLRGVLHSNQQPAIIALGGGTYMQEANRKLLREAGAITVYLEGAFEVLVDRCRQGGAPRPLLQDGEHARQLLAQRRPIYQLAEFSVEVADRSPLAIAQEIAALVLSRNTGRAVPD